MSANGINIQSGANAGIGIVDLMMNQMIMEQLKSINSTGGFTISTIITLVLIMSLTELRSCLGEFIKLIVSKVKEWVPNCITYIFETFKHGGTIITKFQNIISSFRHKPIIVKEEAKEEKFNYSISWNPGIQQSIVVFTNLIKNCSYQKEAKCEIKSDSYTIKYKNMTVKEDTFDIKFPDVNIEFKNNIIHSCQSAKEKFDEFDFGTKDDPTCLCSFIENESSFSLKLKAYVRMINFELQKNAHNDGEYYIVPFIKMKILKRYFDPNIFVTAYHKNWENTQFYYEGVFTFLLKNRYKRINVQVVLFELFLLIRGGYIYKDPAFYERTIKENGINIQMMNLHVPFGYYGLYDVTKIQLEIYSEGATYKIPKPENYFLELEEDIGKSFPLTIISAKPINYEEEFLKFLQKIWDEYEKSRDPNKKEKVGVYELKLKREHKDIIKDNPKYAEYMDQLSLVNGEGKDAKKDEPTEKGSKDKKDANTEHSYPHFVHPFSYHQSPRDLLLRDLGPPPSKTIIHKEEIVTVEQNQVNTVYKGFDTLYLREDDKSYLQCIIDRFNNCSGIYDDLDIPHKLGVLLYGEPGTGKSSTIKVIASHTKRDIYYVDLSNIKKNSELKMVFDHVNKGCVKGGVLVFEDIDCMTDIVRPRKKAEVLEYDVVSTPSEDNILSVMKAEDDKLNLSYFLNLLDGTLSADNLLFVMTTNHIDNLDPALVRNGRVDVKIELKSCDRYQIGAIYKKITGKVLAEEILMRIPEYKHRPIDIVTHILRYYVSGKDDANMMEVFM